MSLTGLALENLQARVRGTTLMALSNEHGHLVLTTGNKSELATGFSTLYGDSAGGFAPIKDVPKSMVWELARWRNAQGRAIPEASITKPPSAELAPGQLDSDRLPPYEVLDVGVEQVQVDLIEAPGVPGLAVKELHGLHAAQVLRQVGVRAACPEPHGPEGVADAPPQKVERNVQKGHDQQRHERQPPVDHEHIDRQADEQPDVGDDADDALDDRLLDRLDVARHARDQPPDGGAVEVAEVQALHLAENLAPDVEDDPLPEPVDQIGVAEPEPEIGGP